MLKLKRVGVLASKRGHACQGADVMRHLAAKGVDNVVVEFGAECSIDQLDACVASVAAEKQRVPVAESPNSRVGIKRRASSG